MAYKKIKGIYKVTCEANGKIYVGKSVNIKVRWSRHRYDLRDGIHWNKEMQKDYNTYGADSFKYEILLKVSEEITTEELDELERKFISTLNTFYDGYNETLGGTGNLGKTFSKETREKMGESRRGIRRPKHVKEKISTTKKKRLVINGYLYLGMDSTAKELGISKDTLLKRLRSDNYPDYKYEEALSKCRTTSRKA